MVPLGKGRVSMLRSTSSSRSRGDGKGIPDAARSGSHHPAPIPAKARPAERASRVARSLASTPGRRKVTGETSVPSRNLVDRPASRPSAT